MFRSIDWILWGLLFGSAVLEITGDLALKWWAETDRWLGLGIGLTAYTIAVGLFALMLRRGELAVVFALWIGAATIGLAIAGYWLFNEFLSWGQLVGVGLTLLGVVLLSVKL
ncbi:MAG: hypothetical protein FOGNACKC_03608 [Anaerolineae bacterium]|nr:hypothetical protein [Anaerolineae bacterium]